MKAVCMLFLLAMSALSVTASAGVSQQDFAFAKVDGQELKLRLFMPEGVKNPPLVVYIHGGGWRVGNYKNCPVQWLAEEGYAVASVGYRLSQVAQFPAQMHDVKAGLRWLRAHAGEYGYNAGEVVVVGHSAGAQLAMLLGMAADHKELEGTVGEHTDQPTRVAAVVEFFGPSDFLLRSTNQPEKTEPKSSPVHKLLGGSVEKNPDKAKLASPVFHVGPGDPPLLVIHGTKDTTVFYDQAGRIVEAYRKAGLEVEEVKVEGAGHGGKRFKQQDIKGKVLAFLAKYLKAPEGKK